MDGRLAAIQIAPTLLIEFKSASEGGKLSTYTIGSRSQRSFSSYVPHSFKLSARYLLIKIHHQASPTLTFPYQWQSTL